MGMSEHLDVELHLAGIADATGLLAEAAAAAGPDARVPTCPGWTVRDLVAHQGMVHRWAAAVVRGEDPRTVDTAASQARGAAHADPVGWLRQGAAELVATLRAAPEDLDVFRFLSQAPPARLFWARRQHHETTIHALDAVSAREQRAPQAADTWYDARTAVDGVDELLTGFWQRRSSGPRASSAPYTAMVAADTGERWERWLLEVGTERTRTTRLPPGEPVPDRGSTVVSGPAADLQLALWNRGGAVCDPAGLLPAWREAGGAVQWG